jgi:tRNA(Arg) A34 adenosine deaminase TadA
MHLRRAIDVAKRSREHGNRPFGAVLAGPDGQQLLEAENTQVTERRCTDHAESNLMRLASSQFDREYLAGSTVYASCEPCPMCAGAIYWGNVRRVVFALDEATIGEYTGNDPEHTLNMPCREVFARGKRETEVIGPALLDEARAVHEGFWTRSS